MTGIELDERLRRLFEDGVSEGELAADPTAPEVMAAFARWLDEPSLDERAGGVSRYLFDVWLSRPDVQAAYPDLRAAGDREGFLTWVVEHGRGELAIPGWLAPPMPATAAAAKPSVGVWLLGCAASEPGGYEAVSRTIAALDAAGVPVLAVQTPAPAASPAPGLPSPAIARFPFRLVCIDEARRRARVRTALPGQVDGRHAIGLWCCEWPAPPAGDLSVFEGLDELWVGSSWVHDVIAPIAPVPVLTVPMTVTVPLLSALTREELGLPEGFLVLSVFDHAAGLQRANPLGLVEAFAQAFADDEDASLVILAVNAERHPRAELALELAAAAAHPRARVVARSVAPSERAAMIAACDLYASLHRLDSSGARLADAMALGRPVLATGWSANVELMPAESTWLVPFELVESEEGDAPGDGAGRWAEPDLHAAVRALRMVHGDPEGALRHASASAKHLLADRRPARVGAVMRARLEALAEQAADRDAPGAPGASAVEAIAVAEALVRREADAQSRRGIRTSVARAESRGAIDAALLHAARELSEHARRLQAGIDAGASAHAELAAQARAGAAQVAGHDARLLELAVERARLAQRVEQLAEDCARLAASNAALEARMQPLLRGAQAIPWTQGEPFTTFEHPVAGTVLGFRDVHRAPSETSYRTFEDVFRGNRERVSGLLGRYVDLLRGHDPVLDVGAGRGELLGLLRDAGIAARGVDLDAGMAAGAAEQGLDVVLADGVDHLESLEPGSLGAVTAIHVVEHLPHARLERFLAAARRALAPGGLVVCETVNPHAGFALKTFWVDPTHQHPLFPETMLVLALAAGLPSAFVTHLRGTGDVDRDRFNEDSYTLVAEAPPADGD